MIKREDLKVGAEFFDKSGDRVTIVYIGDGTVVFKRHPLGGEPIEILSSIDCALKNWSYPEPMNEIDYKILQSNYNDLVGKYVALEQENQKLKELLDLAMGDDGLGFYENEEQWYPGCNQPGYLPEASAWGLNDEPILYDEGKRARATREEILKQLEGM